jgi:hypothetical protein
VQQQAILTVNRIILSHFDSYSAALVFARFGKTLLLPEPLPESAVVMQPPAQALADHRADLVLEAAVHRYGLNAADVVCMSGFDAWTLTGSGPVRVHLLRFTTFLAPAESIAPHGGSFAPISNLRGSPRIELELARRGFNLILGGDAAGS